MASIPLPALAIQPAADPTQGIRNALAIKSMMGQQQLQQQQLQNEQLQYQQQQQALKNTQAITKAYQQWDASKGDYNELAHLALQNGATGEAVQGLQQHGLAIKKQYSDIAKQDAETQGNQLKNAATKNDQLLGALNSVTSGPDEGIGQRLVSAAQNAAQRGLLDPQHLQSIQQLSQLPPDQLKTQLSIFEKSLQAESAQVEQAKNEAQTQEATNRAAESKSIAAKTDLETQNMKQFGGLTPAMAESKYLFLQTRKNQGLPIGADDAAFVRAYEHNKTLVPAAQINLQQHLLTPEAQQMAAQLYTQTGQLPTGLRSPAMGSQILNQAAASNPNVNIAGNKAEYQANADSLKSLQKNFDAVNAFEQTANKNINTLRATLDKIPDLGSKFGNTPVRMLSKDLLGSEGMARFHTDLATVQTEAAKILNSSNASGVLSDSSRHELQTILDPNSSVKQIKASLEELQKDFNNRHQSYADQIQQIKGRMGNGQGNQQSNQPSTNDPLGIR